MKLLILAAILLPSVLLAQSLPPVAGNPVRRTVVQGSQASSETLPENYQITLTITDKDGQPAEMSVVIASPNFNASLAELGLTLQGSLTIEESGSAVVAYDLGWTAQTTFAGNTQQGSSSVSGSVRLKLGEEVQILRAGSRVARLSIKKTETIKPK